jgi:branched-chain amino acid transport system substrate-binding protein
MSRRSERFVNTGRKERAMKRKGFWAVLAVMTMILGSALGVMAEEGVTDTEISIGQWGPQTGPAAAWGSVPRGTGHYFQMINDEGGIHGRKIAYHMFDDAYNPAKTKAGVKQLQEDVGIFAWVGGVGTACGLAVRDYLMAKKVPWVTPATGSRHWIDPPHKYLFSAFALYSVGARVHCKYAYEQQGKKRFALAYQNDDYGKAYLEGATQQLGMYGLKLVEAVPVELRDTDMKPHVNKLKKAKAEVTLICLTPMHAARMVGTGKAMKFDTQWMCSSPCSDFPMMYAITKGAWEGVVAATFAELPDSDLPLMKKYKKAYEKYATKEERWGIFYYAGFAFAEPLVEALQRVGRDLTRERFVQEMEGLRNFKGISGHITFKPFDAKDPMCRQGQNDVFLVQCTKGGGYKVLTDWIEMK